MHKSKHESRLVIVSDILLLFVASIFFVSFFFVYCYGCSMFTISPPIFIVCLWENLRPWLIYQYNIVNRMSMFFFRLHNLQREQENKRKKSAERQRQRRGGRVFRCVSDSTGHLTLAPSRLFERTPMSPSDSLDEIALQIPRYSYIKFNLFYRCAFCWLDSIESFRNNKKKIRMIMTLSYKTKRYCWKTVMKMMYFPCSCERLSLSCCS